MLTTVSKGKEDGYKENQLHPGSPSAPAKQRRDCGLLSCVSSPVKAPGPHLPQGVAQISFPIIARTGGFAFWIPR